MNYFMGEVAEFKKEKESNVKSELKRWGSAAAISGSLGVATPIYGIVRTSSSGKYKISPKDGIYNNQDLIFKTIKPKIKTKLKNSVENIKLLRKDIKATTLDSLAVGLGAYGAYRGGKYLLNKLRNKKDKRKSNFNFPIEKNDIGEFSFGAKLQKFGNTRIGKVFLKDADSVLRTNPVGKSKLTHGIAMSGKTLRKTPFAVAGLGLAGYGGYKAKKTYDKYKPVIKIGRKLNNFLNRGGN